MALFAYFQSTDSVLPNPDGPLLTTVPVFKFGWQQGGETGTRSIQHSRGEEPYADLQAGGVAL